MTNLEKYDEVFLKAFSVQKEDLETLEYQGIAAWDSVGHMTLISDLEDVFEIEIDTDDIIDFSSYAIGKEILKKYHVEF